MATSNTNFVVRNNISVLGNGTSDFVGDITTSGNVTIGGTLSSSGNVSHSNTITVNLIASGNINAANLISSDGLTVSGNSTIVGSLIVNGGNAVANTTQAALTLIQRTNIVEGETNSGSGGSTSGTLKLNNSINANSPGQLITGIAFTGAGSGGRRRALIATYQDGDDQDRTGLKFFTYGSTATGSDAVSERMTIASDGEVIINRSATPQQNVSIFSDSAGNWIVGNSPETNRKSFQIAASSNSVNLILSTQNTAGSILLSPGLSTTLAAYSNNVVDARSIVQASGLSTSFGVTTGNSVGAFVAKMGITNQATWLLSGTSNGNFRCGIQALDSDGRMRIYSNGNSSFVSVDSGKISVVSGSVSNLSLTFDGDPTTGFYKVSNGTMGIVASGQNIANITSTTISVAKDLTVSGNVIFSQDLTVSGNVVINGSVTTINSTILSVDDKNIILGNVSTPSNTTADGGGITLQGTTDKTLLWDTTNTNWTSSEHWNLNRGKVYKINNVEVLSNTTLGSSIVNSSLTSVGTLTSLTVSGNVNISNISSSGVIISSGRNIITNATSSEGTNQGALVVSGGAGISDNVYVGKNLVVSANGFFSKGVLIGGTLQQDLTETYAVNISTNVTGANNLVDTRSLIIDGSILAENVQNFYAVSATKVLSNAGNPAKRVGNIFGYYAHFSSTSQGTITNVYNFYSRQSLSSPNNQYAYWTDFNYNGSANANNWAIYASGTADSLLNGRVLVTNTAPSINTSSGALVVSGGVGVSGNINVGGIVSSPSVSTDFIALQDPVATIASAANISPASMIAFVSGTTAIFNIIPTSPVSINGGQITLIPTGAWSSNNNGTNGNIAANTRATPNVAITYTYVATTKKWYPNISN